MRDKLYYAAIRNRTHTYELPSPDFDPRAAEPAVLEKHGIPLRPDPVREPEMHAFWQRLVSVPLKFVRPEFPIDPDPTGVELRSAMVRERDATTTQPAPPVGRGHRERSWNWSGAYITPIRPRRFSIMVGRWFVPTVKLPRTLPIVDGHPERLRNSAWIGFDGHRGRYPLASMPQMGTNHFLKNAGGTITTEYGAWWQWWKAHPDPVSDPANEMIPITNFTVAPGDEILAGMVVTASQDVLFFIKNQTSGLFTSFLGMAPGVIAPIGSTAEWICERLTNPTDLKLYALPDYGTVKFDFCLASSAMKPLAPGITQSLAGGGRYIDMRERFAGPHRTALVSLASKAGPAGVTCRYSEPGRTS